MMKKILCLLVLILLLSGCRNVYVDVDGVRYEALNEEEEQQMVTSARVLARGLRKKLSPSEKKIVASEAPKVKILYAGDKAGTARIRWTLPERILEIRFVGKFLDSGVSSQIYTMNRTPDVINSVPKAKRRKIR